MQREIIAIRKDIAPNTSGELKEILKYTGMIEEVRIRFYSGVERSLKVRPYVLRDSRKPENLFTFPEGTEPFISGNDDYLVFPSSLNINTDDELKVYYINENIDFTYTLSIDVVVAYD